MVFLRFGRTVPAALVLLLAAAAALAQVPSSQHVVLVIDENSSYSNVMANMPWLVAQGNANGYASNYQSDNGGSLLNYLWLASGSCESSANCTLLGICNADQQELHHRLVGLPGRGRKVSGWCRRIDHSECVGFHRNAYLAGASLGFVGCLWRSDLHGGREVGGGEHQQSA